MLTISKKPFYWEYDESSILIRKLKEQYINWLHNLKVEDEVIVFDTFMLTHYKTFIHKLHKNHRRKITAVHLKDYTTFKFPIVGPKAGSLLYGEFEDQHASKLHPTNQQVCKLLGIDGFTFFFITCNAVSKFKLISDTRQPY